MAVKPNPEHVPDFPLVPIGRGPEVSNGLVARILSLERHLETEVLVAVYREELINEGKVTCGLTGWGGPADALIDGTQVEEQREGGPCLLLEIEEDLPNAFRRYPQGRRAVPGLLLDKFH